MSPTHHAMHEARMNTLTQSMRLGGVIRMIGSGSFFMVSNCGQIL